MFIMDRCSCNQCKSTYSNIFKDFKVYHWQKSKHDA